MMNLKFVFRNIPAYSVQIFSSNAEVDSNLRGMGSSSEKYGSSVGSAK